MTVRRLAFLAATLAIVAVAPSIAFAQAWPTRPVMMIVPSPAGGAIDLLI
jgi:tripartite-type tricarboxylate transporter receptor subunit TctC